MLLVLRPQLWVWWCGFAVNLTLLFLVVSILCLGLAYLSCVSVGCRAWGLHCLWILGIGCSGVCWGFPVPVCCLCRWFCWVCWAVCSRGLGPAAFICRGGSCTFVF